MDKKYNCIWKNKDFPQRCMHIKHKDEKCHCNLEPCPFYEKKTLFKVLKYKLIGGLKHA